MRSPPSRVASLGLAALCAAALAACHGASSGTTGGGGGTGGMGGMGASSSATGAGGAGGSVPPRSTIPCGTASCDLPELCCGMPASPACVAENACSTQFRALCFDDSDCVLAHCCATIQWGPSGALIGASTTCEATCDPDDEGTPGGPFQVTGSSCTTSFDCPGTGESCCNMSAFPVSACVYDAIDVTALGATCD